jgi:hypothetical protein
VKFQIADEVFMVRGYGGENDPPVRGTIYAVDTKPRWGAPVYIVQDENYRLWRCSESWLILVHPVIRETPTLADA